MKVGVTIYLFHPKGKFSVYCIHELVTLRGQIEHIEIEDTIPGQWADALGAVRLYLEISLLAVTSDSEKSGSEDFFQTFHIALTC